MKDIERLFPTYKLNNLPELAEKSFYIGKGKNKRVAYTGTIFRRRLDGPIKGKLYWHYAFYYGCTNDGTLLFIENNTQGVECVTWDDFIFGVEDWEVVHIENTPDRFEEIMNRAKKKAKEVYEGGENNCEHLVNYAVNGKNESIQADNTKKVVDLVFTVLEARIMMSPSNKDHKLLDRMDEIRNLLKVNRNEELTKSLSKLKTPKTK